MLRVECLPFLPYLIITRDTRAVLRAPWCVSHINGGGTPRAVPDRTRTGPLDPKSTRYRCFVISGTSRPPPPRLISPPWKRYFMSLTYKYCKGNLSIMYTNTVTRHTHASGQRGTHSAHMRTIWRAARIPARSVRRTGTQPLAHAPAIALYTLACAPALACAYSVCTSWHGRNKLWPCCCG